MIRLAALLALLTAPLQAQTVAEAATANTVLGAELCVLHFRTPDRKSTKFTQTGFAYESHRGSPNDITAVYSAPGGTAKVELYQGQTAPDCQVLTNHVDAFTISQQVAAMLRQVYPGVFRIEATADGCLSATELGAPLPMIVAVGPDGPHSCRAPGPTRISIFFAV